MNATHSRMSSGERDDLLAIRIAIQEYGEAYAEYCKTRHRVRLRGEYDPAKGMHEAFAKVSKLVQAALFQDEPPSTDPCPNCGLDLPQYIAKIQERVADLADQPTLGMTNPMPCPHCDAGLCVEVEDGIAALHLAHTPEQPKGDAVLREEIEAVKQSRDFALKHIHWLDQMLGAPGAANSVITNLRTLADKLEATGDAAPRECAQCGAPTFVDEITHCINGHDFYTADQSLAHSRKFKAAKQVAEQGADNG